MRKVFLFISAMLLAATVSAKEIRIGSATSNIIGSTLAASSTENGDVIILTDNGPYLNHYAKEGGDDYSLLEKDITIKADEGVSPVVKLEVPFRSKYGKTAKFIGIKFDGTLLSNYDFYFRCYDNNNNTLKFEDCEFYSISKYIVDIYNGSYKADSLVFTNCLFHDNTNRGIINRGTVNHIIINGGKFYNFTGDYPVIQNYDNATLGKLELDGVEFYNNDKAGINGTPTSRTGSCIINNCYFHNNHKNAVLFEKSTVEGVHSISNFTLTNTTIANNDSLTDYNSQVYLRPYNDADTNTIKVIVDHCTFYNNPTINSDHSHLRFYKIKDVTITNTIFAHAWPATDVDESHKYARYAAVCEGGTVSNCIAYNYLKNTSGFSGPTVTNSSKVDPLFTNAAGGNFTLSSTSPALMSSTNWTNLGAPRWWPTPATLPSTDFSSPYSFAAVNAKLIGDIALNESNHIKYLDKEVCGLAAWPIHISKAGAIQATLNMESGSTNGHIFKIVIFDTKGNKVDSIAEPSQSTSDADILLSGTIYIPAADDYIVALYNTQSWSSAKIEGITLAHAGGDIVDIPATLTVDKAWYGNGGTRANNQISFSNWNNANSWIKWNIATTDNAYCNIILSISSTNAHSMKVFIYEEGKTDTIKVGESFTEASGDDPIILNFGKVYFPKGKKYVVKVTNPTSGSAAKVNNLQFEEISITTINIPDNASLLPATAMLSKRAGIVSGDPDKIDFVSNGDSRSHVVEEWARWKINVTEACSYIFTANVTSSTGQYYAISVLNCEESATIGEKIQSSDIGSGDKTMATDPIALSEGEYIVKITNPYKNSDGCVKSISIAQATPVTISENASNLDDITDAATVDAELTRTLVAGMYNTICLPFAVSAAEMSRVFPGAVVKELSSSSLEDGDFVLNLNFDAVSEMTAGKAYIIQPAANIVNPKFIGVTIDKTLRPTNTSKANFVGNFVAGTIDADPNNLFLGAENTLYFPTAEIDILGMRAYFVVHDAPAHMIRRARIVENEQVVTEIELVNQEPKANNQKLIENGQLIIVRDGVRYNVMGTKIQ